MKLHNRGVHSARVRIRIRVSIVETDTCAHSAEFESISTGAYKHCCSFISQAIGDESERVLYRTQWKSE